MHVFFSGIGGTGISALAVMAKQAGYEVSGSDARPSGYLDDLRKKGIDRLHVGVDSDFIAKIHAEKPIDWYVYGSAQPIDFPDHPEFAFCEEHGIRMSKRDELLNKIIIDKKLKLVAVAGTHGKTTTTAMAVWLFKQLGAPVSYSIGAKVNFGEMSHYDPKAEYFIYEADEYDKNFLAFQPYISLITGIDWDHPDIYPSRQEYYDAFRQFFKQSKHAVLWRSDIEKLEHTPTDQQVVLDENDAGINEVELVGLVNRQNAWLVANGLSPLLGKPVKELASMMGGFPGLSRRFEMIAPNLYVDAAHTPPKIRGALQIAHETAGQNVVVIYEGLHNLRQHHIKEDLKDLFNDVKKLYIVPTYLAREDKKLKLLSPADLLNMLSNKSKSHAETAELNEKLKQTIDARLAGGDLVLCLTAGSVNSLDEWLRSRYK